MIKLEALPMPLSWQPQPQAWQSDGSSLEATAAPETDLFIDPLGKLTNHSAAKLLFDNHEDFTLSARVQVGFRSTFDAGVLCVYHDETNWAKLCLEYSPQGQAMIVSVVTKGSSDDCNSSLVEGDAIYLRLSRIGAAHAFHTSHDAGTWQLVRVFKLHKPASRAGFLVQSPVGDGCTVRFSNVHYQQQTLSDIRSGA